MGNCISFTRWRAINDDEESAGLVPETLPEAQEKALILANEELRSCDAELQSSREEAISLRDRLQHIELERDTLARQKRERDYELEAVRRELSESGEALRAATEEASMQATAKRDAVLEKEAAELINDQSISELEAKLEQQYNDICARKSAHNEAIQQHRVPKEVLARAEEEMKDLKEQLAESKATIMTWQHAHQSTLASEPSDRTYSEAYRFSETADKDLRVSIGWWQGELRVDVREFHSGRQSRKGVSIPVQDASKLAQVLPDVVWKAKGMLYQ